MLPQITQYVHPSLPAGPSNGNSRGFGTNHRRNSMSLIRLIISPRSMPFLLFGSIRHRPIRGFPHALSLWNIARDSLLGRGDGWREQRQQRMRTSSLLDRRVSDLICWSGEGNKTHTLFGVGQRKREMANGCGRGRGMISWIGFGWKWMDWQVDFMVAGRSKWKRSMVRRWSGQTKDQDCQGKEKAKTV